MNDRVVVEAVAVPAESLLVDVKEPTDAELSAFFDEYKDLEPMPDRDWGIELPSPNPAFAIPQKVAVQYLLADYNQFLTKVEDEVTDAEIEKFYEDNKDPYFIRAESVLSEPDDTTGREDGRAGDANRATKRVRRQGRRRDKTGARRTRPHRQPTTDRRFADSQSPFRLTAFAEDAPAGGKQRRPATQADRRQRSDRASCAAASRPHAAPTAELAAPAEKPKEFQPLDEVRDQIRRDDRRGEGHRAARRA